MNIVELPAFIDMHVHFREPGYEYKETIETGLNAALKGGFCAVCAMPNTNPVCDNIETLNYILEMQAVSRLCSYKKLKHRRIG